MDNPEKFNGNPGKVPWTSRNGSMDMLEWFFHGFSMVSVYFCIFCYESPLQPGAISFSNKHFDLRLHFKAE